MKSLSQSCCYLTQSLPETKRLKAIGVKGYLFPIIYSKMQRGKVEKGENIAQIRGMLHAEFLQKIFALHAHLDLL